MLVRGRGGVATTAADVYEAKAVGLARSVASPVSQALLTQRLASDANPLLPFGGGLRWVIGVQEQISTTGTYAGLGLQQTQAELVQRRRRSAAPTVGPILGQGRIIR